MKNNINLLKKYGFVFLFMFAALSGFAENWTITQKTDIKTEVADSSGKTLSITSETPLSDKDFAKICAALDTVWAIPGLKGSHASAKNENGGFFRLVVYPTSLSVGTVSLLPYLPSGIAFYYDTALFYDVSLKVNNMLPRVAGAYIDPDDFLRHLVQATKVPEWFMADTHLLNRVDRLEKALTALLNRNWRGQSIPVSEKVVIAIIGYHNENPQISQKQALAKLKTAGYSATAKDVQAVFAVYLGIVEF